MSPEWDCYPIFLLSDHLVVLLSCYSIILLSYRLVTRSSCCPIVFLSDYPVVHMEVFPICYKDVYIELFPIPKDVHGEVLPICHKAVLGRPARILFVHTSSGEAKFRKMNVSLPDNLSAKLFSEGKKSDARMTAGVPKQDLNT